MDYFLAVKAFNRIVETGSFVKAAAQLDLHPNVMTKLVQTLESHLRVRLLNRTTRRVTLTDEGSVYYERMSRVLDQWLEVESEMAITQANPKGRIRVDMGTTIATHLVIPALPEFNARYPGIQIEIGASDRTHGALPAGGAYLDTAQATLADAAANRCTMGGQPDTRSIRRRAHA